MLSELFRTCLQGAVIEWCSNTVIWPAPRSRPEKETGHLNTNLIFKNDIMALKQISRHKIIYQRMYAIAQI